jgi:hypothetical protein
LRNMQPTITAPSIARPIDRGRGGRDRSHEPTAINIAIHRASPRESCSARTVPYQLWATRPAPCSDTRALTNPSSAEPDPEDRGRGEELRSSKYGAKPTLIARCEALGGIRCHRPDLGRRAGTRRTKGNLRSPAPGRPTARPTPNARPGKCEHHHAGEEGW